jgi:predicted nucleic acid-binding protein
MAELDYLLATRVGVDAELSFLDEVARGAYRLEQFAAEDIAAARSVVSTYRDADVGLADASIVILAIRYGVLDVLTLDRRHFDALRGPGGHRFHLTP